MSGDPYLYPGTQTLINSEDIHDPDELELAERLITRVAMRRPMEPPPDMSPEGLQAIHRHIFEEIYPWAGELRTINLAKPLTEKESVEFLEGPFVRPNLMRFFGELADDSFLNGLDADKFAYRAAVYIEDLNFIHPFRDGNGRVQRFFLEHLARQAGHTLDRLKIRAEDWMAGAKQSHRQPINGDHDIMTRTIRQAIVGNSLDHKDGEKRRRRQRR